MGKLRTACILSMILIFTASSSGLAEDLTPAQHQTAQEIFLSVLSPFCPGRALNDCPSEQAAELKDHIRQELRGGKTEDAILAELYATYGENIRGVPRVSGFGSAAWFVPLAFLLTGAAVIFIWVRRQSGGAQGLTQPAPEVDSSMAELIERELRK